MTPKERFKAINGAARYYLNNISAQCPPTLPFILWCGKVDAFPINVVRCQLTFITKAKETAWALVRSSEKYYPGWLQDKKEELEYNRIVGSTKRRVRKAIVFQEEELTC